MNARSACKINGYKYPAADEIGGRTSTICRSMACTLVERKACDPVEEKQWMIYFPNKTCAYCGAKATHLDHLYPLIINRLPSGYGTEPANLVPCCARCNQSKGNMEWEEFMRSSKCLQVADKDGDEKKGMVQRIEILRKFQQEMRPHVVQIDEDTKRRWTKIRDEFDSALKNAHVELSELKKKLYGK